MRFGQTSSPSQFLYELAGEERRYWLWTDPQANGADERLPLLSDRERQRLIERSLPQHRPAQSPKRLNNPAGAPGRHGLSWSADEDDRLRAAFQAGDAIAAIASAHERKIGAITARLVRLGLISEDGVVDPG